MKKKMVLCLAWNEQFIDPEDNPSQIERIHRCYYRRVEAPMEFMMSEI
jgi:hypothetical protein